jgi:hypothetical protein
MYKEGSMKVTYTCGKCGGSDVQLLFPVWVDANDIDDKEEWEMICETRPEQDSSECWCRTCDGHVELVRHEEEEEPEEVKAS